MRSWITGLASAALILIGMLPASVGADTSNGVFSVRCRFSHQAPDDPIVHPGHSGMAHSHDFFGNRSTNAASTYESMVQAPTSCDLPEDTSAYWVPTLLTPSGSPAPVKWVLAYYRNLPVFEGRTRAYPEDFRMIAGYPTVQTGTDKVLGWSCNDSDPYLATPPDCGNGSLRLHLVFPNCWDGVNIDSANHRSHVSYPVGGRCPGTHPVKLPRMSLHVHYGVSDGRGYWLASDAENGTSDGRSAHGDFWNTWEQSALKHLVKKCLQPGTSCLHVRSVPVDSSGDGGTSAPDGSMGRCLGMPVTERGTQGSDRVVGTSAAEVVSTLRGRDVIRSRSGDDRVCSGSGVDTVRGGWGRDRLRGGDGSDLLTGGPGRDVLLGGPGRDRCFGGAGRDIARGCEVRKRI
jgi:hypothetical protein